MYKMLKLSHIGHSCWKCIKEETKHIKIPARRKCFSNRKETYLLNENWKKIASAVATLHKTEMIFIARYWACRFLKKFKICIENMRTHI